MATFTAIRNKKQTAGSLKGVLYYVMQEKKTKWHNGWFVTGHNCVPQSASAEMAITKQRFHKTDKRQFYHFVQSFPEQDNLTPAKVNAIGLEIAKREFPEFEVVVATHVDAGHLHNHLIVNSVNCEDGKKLHQNKEDLLAHRRANDEICKIHGLYTLETPDKHSQKKRMKPGEYQAGLRGESWKLDLIQAINEALEYADDKESFISNMEYEGYHVVWTDTRKHITFITPEGRRCRDNSLHDETFLKENLEILFAYRQAIGFSHGTLEPDQGWLGEITSQAARFGTELAQAMDMPLDKISTWTESKQRSREALKKMAHGQKFGGEDEYYGYEMS